MLKINQELCRGIECSLVVYVQERKRFPALGAPMNNERDAQFSKQCRARVLDQRPRQDHCVNTGTTHSAAIDEFFRLRSIRHR